MSHVRVWEGESGELYFAGKITDADFAARAVDLAVRGAFGGNDGTIPLRMLRLMFERITTTKPSQREDQTDGQRDEPDRGDRG